MNKMIQKENPEHVTSLIDKTSKVTGEKVLIFGASNFSLVDRLVKQNKKITLIDIRQKPLDNFKEFGKSVKLRLVKEGYEFEGLSDYHTIFFYDTLHHIKNKNKKIKECSRILTKGGSIILYEPNICSKLSREYDQFGELKNSMYKFNLFRILRKNGFKIGLLSSEKLLSRKRRFKSLIISLQKTRFDPRYRIILIAKKKF